MDQSKKVKIESAHKRFFYSVCLVLWLSGALWLYVRYCLRTSVDITDQSYSYLSLLLKIHGAAAMVFLVVWGALLYHIFPGWNNRRQRPSGVSMVITCLVLILTGWGLYYIGNDGLRNLTSLMHSIFGIIFPVVIFFHVFRVIRSNRE